MNFVHRTYYRWRARRELRKIPKERRAEVMQLAADACRHCETVSAIKPYVELRSRPQPSMGRLGFGIAEILIIIQIVMLLYKIAQYMGWLKTATPRMVAEELGE